MAQCIVQPGSLHWMEKRPAHVQRPPSFCGTANAFYVGWECHSFLRLIKLQQQQPPPPISLTITSFLFVSCPQPLACLHDGSPLYMPTSLAIWPLLLRYCRFRAQIRPVHLYIPAGHSSKFFVHCPAAVYFPKNRFIFQIQPCEHHNRSYLGISSTRRL